MKFLDLFAGIGGFRLGMESAGHECVGYVEWDKFARKSYETIHNTEGEWTAHDITAVTDNDIRLLRGRGIDVICGGFPCQAFSVAGKRGGFDDTRGTLFFEIARFAKQIKPRFLFLENVKGLLSHDQGNTFGTILNTLDELGYDAEWQVLNSKDFGVPQNRERVFIIGHLRGSGGREVFPIERNDSEANTTKIIKVGNIRRMGKSQSGDVMSVEGLAPTMCSTTTQKDPPKIIVAGDLNHYENDQMNRVYSPNGIAPTLTVPSGGGREHKIVQAVLTPERINKSQNGRLVKDPGEPMFTLTAQDRHGVAFKIPAPDGTFGTLQVGGRNGVPDHKHHRGMAFDGYRIRKLTPKECWRLQGFPDSAFEKAAEVNSDSQLYKQAGNSVTVNVIYEIAKRLS